MSTPKELHTRAMSYNFKAHKEKSFPLYTDKATSQKKIQEYLNLAFALEKEAAYLYIQLCKEKAVANTEPTRFILLRSAANLAL